MPGAHASYAGKWNDTSLCLPYDGNRASALRPCNLAEQGKCGYAGRGRERLRCLYGKPESAGKRIKIPQNAVDERNVIYMEKQAGQNPDIRIYVVCHKPAYVPENPYLYPIQVGTALSGKKLPGMLHDDEGDNISERNKTYCELTAQYWAWKNEEADYYGFFHYRRYLAFDPSLNKDDGWGNIAYDRISEEAIEEMKLQPEIMRDLITKYDVISVRGRRYPRIKTEGKTMDVYHEYGMVPFQHRKDLDITLQILKEKYPAFAQTADSYMQSETAHECNMFIMKKEIYKNYCAWLFDILFEAEKRIDSTWYSVEEYRVMGYLAERLCGIYYEWLKTQPGIRSGELPKTLFKETAPKAVLEPVYPAGVPIVLSANDKFSPYLDIMIRSVIANASPEREYDIIILYNDISEKNQHLISMAARDKQNISIRFIRVCEYFDAGKLFVDQHLSVETYYRLIIPEIMPNYHKILYLDCDMVADHDVAELYDFDLKGAVIGAAKDIDVAGQLNLNQNNWQTYATETLGLDSPYDYFQAGVLILDLDGLRRTMSSEDMIQMALTHCYRCHDQDILNIVCKNKVTYLPQQWNTLMDWQEIGRSRMDILKMAPRQLYEAYTQARKRPYLIHFAGYQKPWDVVDCDFAEYFWEYAKLSPYYPMILRKTKRCLMDEREAELSRIARMEQNAGIRKIANKVLPIGSRRRELIKYLIQMRKNA